MSNTAASSSATATPPSLNQDTSLGTTTINDSVVAKVVGLAASAVPGVHALGGGAARAIGAIRGALNQKDISQGVSVEVGETQVAADVSLVAEYPVSLQQVADDVRTAIIDAIESLVGLQVTEVNITVNDVFIPSEDDDAQTESRVQ